MSASPLASAVRAALTALADPAKAGPMQAYMKSAMPFLGVDAPTRRQAVLTLARATPCQTEAALSRVVLDLWRSATHREQRYAALDLLRLPAHRRLMGWPLLPVLEEMLRTGPWWAFNDAISGRALPLLLQRHPAEMKPVLRRWACSDELWFRRAAMLAQRSLKRDLDAVLLYDCILPSLLDRTPLAREYFIRKGMGWALRERSYAAPEEVRAFCRKYADELSPLTRREALRVIDSRTSSAAPASP